MGMFGNRVKGSYIYLLNGKREIIQIALLYGICCRYLSKHVKSMFSINAENNILIPTY